jgi:hypothetical protein
MSKLTTRERLSDPAELDKFCDAVVSLGTIKKAAEKLGVAESTLWRARHNNPELERALWGARQEAADKHYDSCIDIAMAATPETVTVARLQIDTHMRVAGHLLPKTYGTAPGSQVNVVNQVALVCDEETRARLIAMRERITLQDRQPEEAVA